MVFRDVACFLNKVKDRQNPYIVIFDFCCFACRKCAWNVFKEAAACDVCNALYVNFFQNCKCRFYIKLCRCKKCFAKCAAKTFNILCKVCVSAGL